LRGATLGFAFFNRPVAKLFLCDVGSLPIGLVLGWLLVVLAGSGARTAAVLLPLYYIADSAITLLRRAANRESVWQPHRTHFYQRATDRGFRVIGVVARVFALNLALVALALTTMVLPSPTIEIAALIAGPLISPSQVAWSVDSCFGSACRPLTRAHAAGSDAQPPAARHKITPSKMAPVRNPESR
jgi:hypothetical protein